MRVLQLVQKPLRRGAQIFAQQLSRWLRNAGIDVHIVYLYPNDEPGALSLDPGDEVLGGNESSLLERMPGIDPRLVRSLLARCERIDPDIVQVNGGRAVKYGAAIKSMVRRPRFSLLYRNIDSPVFWVNGRLRTAMYRHLVMPRIDALVGLSHRTLDEVLGFYRLRVPHRVIPNGVDLGSLRGEANRDELRAQFDTPDDAFVAAFIGHLSRQKRPDRFLRVIARCAARDPHVYGWVIGDGPNRAALEAQAHRLGIAGRIRFAGSVDRIGSYVLASDVYVSTSDTEGVPAAVIEVGHLGRPTIAPRVGGLPECVRDDVTGILVAPGDEAGLAESILSLARDPARNERLGQRAANWVNARYSIDVVGSQYLEFYRELRA